MLMLQSVCEHERRLECLLADFEFALSGFLTVALLLSPARAM
jgi:hypothetical protein